MSYFLLALCASSIRSAPQTLEKLISWCSQCGVGGVENIKLSSVAGSGLAVFAARDIEAGQEVLRIPLRLALADRLLPGVDGKPPPSTPWRNAPWQAALAARLVKEQQGSSSAWQPWLEVLPDQLQGLQLGDLSELHYEPAIAELIALRADRTAVAKHTADALSSASIGFADAAVSASRIEHALTLANTRAFLLEIDPQDPWACCHAFVPLLDCFNHAPLEASQVEWSLEGSPLSDGCLTVVARVPTAAGQQLQLTYDPTATNDDYALYHGFCPSSNAMDDVELFASAEAAIGWHRATFPCASPNEDLAATALYLAAMPPLEGTLRTRRVGVASAGPKGLPLWLRADEVDPRLLAVCGVGSLERIVPLSCCPCLSARAWRAVMKCVDQRAACPMTLARRLYRYHWRRCRWYL